MSWVPDRDDREGELNKRGHVAPPERNPVPEREQQQDERDDD